MIVTKETRELSCSLTDAEVLEMGKMLAAKTMEIEETKNHAKSVSADYKAKVDEMAAANNVLSRKVNSFDKDTHTYRDEEGSTVESVTQILQEWILANGYYVNTYDPSICIAESAMKAAGDHGTAVHDAINIILTNTLDWSVLDPSLVHQLREFERWREEYKPMLVSAGYPMMHMRKRYAGTPDPFYVIRINGRDVLCFVEIKTGGHLLAGPQLAAYVEMYREHSRFKGEIQRWVLWLPKEAPYKFEARTNRADWHFFEARLYQRNYIASLTNAL